MNILLAGEFSGLHSNLAKGLRKLGHNVTVISSGDSWKGFEADVLIDPKTKPLARHLQCLSAIVRMKKFDVVQFVNPICFPVNPRFNYWMIKLLLSKNSRTFLMAAGDDAYYWKNGAERLDKYTPFDDMLKYDLKNSVTICQDPRYVEFNEHLASAVTKIIPCAFDYWVCYKGIDNLTAPIPLPVDLTEFEYTPNVVKNGKVRVFHGLNRVGMKGTRYVEKAFEILKQKYSSEAEFIIEGRLPFPAYIKAMKEANIVVDQVNSYGWGLNAAMGLALGRVVVSGAEPEALGAFGLETSPLINIRPSVDDIVSQVATLIENKKGLLAIGEESRLFAEKMHDSVKVASRFIKVWEGR